MIISQSTSFNICAICLISSIVSGIDYEEFDLQRQGRARHRRGASITPTNICNTWSKWINNNHPSPSHRMEEEHLDPTMVETLCPKALGGAVIRFECLDEDNKITFTGNKTSSGWTQIHHCNVTDMYVLCTIDSRSSSQCPDMSLRFYCFCDHITTTTPNLPTAIPATFPAVTKSTTSPSPSTSTTTTTMSTTITSTPWWTDSTTVTFVPLVTTRRTTLKRTKQTPIAVPIKTTTDVSMTVTSQTPKPLVATSTKIPMMFPVVTPTALPPKIITSSTPPTTTSTAMSSTITSTPWWTDSTTITYQQKLTTRRTTTKQTTKTPATTLLAKSSTAPRKTSNVMIKTATTKSVRSKQTTDYKAVESNSSVDINHFDSLDGEEDEMCYYYEPSSGFDVGNTHVSWWIINLVISILLFCVCCTVLWCMYKRLKKNRKRKASAVQPILDV